MRVSPSITIPSFPWEPPHPWAAAGALKNLALSPNLRAPIIEAGAPHALCALARSRCWLQNSKSRAALGFLEVRDCKSVQPRPLRVSLKHALHLRGAESVVEL